MVRACGGADARARLLGVDVSRRSAAAAPRVRRLQLYPQGQSNQGTHLSVFLDSSPERASNLAELQKCEFSLTLRAAWDPPDGSGTGDVVKGASTRRAHAARDAPDARPRPRIRHRAPLPAHRTVVVSVWALAPRRASVSR